ncbi:MAG: SPFH domain-containing protein [Acholeplasmatales bacterium]|jgi:membrane protease subunit (stomatin/prohibitin family)|nr:SPFH domain-containing protein [Acholeplasmatales bacterium]
MGLLKLIEWKEVATSTKIVYKFPIGGDYINKGSKITVRDGQVAIFADKGRMADVFLPGMYTLDTNNVPFLTKLMSWKYGFESPFKSDIYFVKTTQFINQKWGTSNPIMLRDKDFGAVRIRGFGTYSFQVSDAYVFMTQISGTGSYETTSIVEWLKSILVKGISDALGENKIPVLDLAANLDELSTFVEKKLAVTFAEYGLKLNKFNFENVSLPPELEKTLDEVAGLNLKRGVMDVYTQVGQVDALKEAAKNPGSVGTFMGAGIGMGFGNQMAQNMGNQQTPKVKCIHCSSLIEQNLKFCPVCGKPQSEVCPSCGHPVSSGAKFCPDCGKSIASTCPKCGSKLAPGAKFCPDCGTKI